MLGAGTNSGCRVLGAGGRAVEARPGRPSTVPVNDDCSRNAVVVILTEFQDEEAAHHLDGANRKSRTPAIYETGA